MMNEAIVKDRIIISGTEEMPALELKIEPIDEYFDTCDEQLMTSIKEEPSLEPNLTEYIDTSFEIKQEFNEGLDLKLEEEVIENEDMVDSVNYCKTELDIVDEQMCFQEVIYTKEMRDVPYAPDSYAADPLLLSYQKTLNKPTSGLGSTFPDSMEERSSVNSKSSLHETESLQDVCQTTFKELEKKSWSTTSKELEKESRTTASKELEKETLPTISKVLDEETRPITFKELKIYTRPATSKVLDKETQPIISKQLYSESQDDNFNVCQIVVHKTYSMNLKSTLDKAYPLLDGNKIQPCIELEKKTFHENLPSANIDLPLECMKTKYGKLTSFELKQKVRSLMFQERDPTKTRVRCFAPACTAIDSDNTHFFYFPSNLERTREWLQRVGINCSLEEAKPLARRKLLCSRHFGDDQYLTPKKRKLISTAVPFPLYHNNSVDVDSNNES